MVEVELVGDEPPGAGPQPEPVAERVPRALAAVVRSGRRAAAVVVPPAARAWRRPATRWVALGVVAALVAVPVADASRERTRLAALAQIPGVLRPLHPGMTRLYTLDNDDGVQLTSGTLVGGTVVSSLVPQRTSTESDGATPVVGFDPATGKRRWSTVVPAVNLGGTITGTPLCAAAAAVAVCVAQEEVAGAYPTSLWVLDPTDGRVLRSATVGEHGGAAAAGGELVVAQQVDGPDRAPASGPWAVTWRVSGEDAATGAVRWSWTSPPVDVAAVAEDQNLTHDPADYASSIYTPQISPAPGHDVVLNVGDDSWVLSPDGAVRTHVARPGGWTVWEARGAVMRQPASAGDGAAGPIELLRADGTWQAVKGEEMWLAVDDGSAPGVVLLAAQNDDGSAATVDAVDVRTGATLWSVASPTTLYIANGVLFGGRLYIATQNPDATDDSRVIAYDATTGTTVWSRPSGGSGLLATDGTVLVAPAPDGSPNAVQAYALDDGRPLWQDDLRDAVSPQGVTSGTLAGVAALDVVRRLSAERPDGSITVLQ